MQSKKAYQKKLPSPIKGVYASGSYGLPPEKIPELHQQNPNTHGRGRQASQKGITISF